MLRIHLLGRQRRHPGWIWVSRALASVFFCFFLNAVLGCSAPKKDSTPLGKKAAIDSVNNFLSTQQCGKAIDEIEPVYNSSASDNEVRFARSNAHACAAGVDFIGTNLGLATGGSLSGSGFWSNLAKIFPKAVPIPGVPDSQVENAWKAQDALMAMLLSGTVVPDKYKNDEYDLHDQPSHNVGSLVTTQRTDDSNLYMIYASMAAMGALQNRYSGTIPRTGTKNFPLGYKNYATDGWQKIANMDIEGCSFAGSFLLMLDGIIASSRSLGKLRNALSQVETLATYINNACELGCQGSVPSGYPGTGTGCSGIPSGACNPCPFSLRRRTSCTTKVDNREGCAAAGIAYFVTNDPSFGWLGP